MKTIDIDLDVYKAIEAGRLRFGEGENAILRRLLGIDAKPPRGERPIPRNPRSSGAYSTTLGTKQLEANSLKELVRRAMLVGRQQKPDLLEDLSALATPKGRRMVARSAAALYPKSPHLTEFAERLADGWWFDGNIGRNQALAYLKTIARLLHVPTLPTISKRSEKTAVTLEDLLAR